MDIEQRLKKLLTLVRKIRKIRRETYNRYHNNLIHKIDMIENMARRSFLGLMKIFDTDSWVEAVKIYLTLLKNNLNDIRKNMNTFTIDNQTLLNLEVKFMQINTQLSYSYDNNSIGDSSSQTSFDSKGSWKPYYKTDVQSTTSLKIEQPKEKIYNQTGIIYTNDIPFDLDIKNKSVEYYMCVSDNVRLNRLLRLDENIDQITINENDCKKVNIKYPATCYIVYQED